MRWQEVCTDCPRRDTTDRILAPSGKGIVLLTDGGTRPCGNLDTRRQCCRLQRSAEVAFVPSAAAATAAMLSAKVGKPQRRVPSLQKE